MKFDCKDQAFCLMAVTNEVVIKLTKLIQKDFVFINTDSRSRLWIIAETKQNLPSWLNEGNSCMNTSSFRRRSMGC